MGAVGASMETQFGEARSGCTGGCSFTKAMPAMPASNLIIHRELLGQRMRVA